ncbi:SusD/RagB family nutrient-binding outer membrane lipoprotein [uncultured Polaribacter sp.]|uniref:SusD/RagB family nutrient-binding outer membrane lipoprotein n=1 Tax=uncultured Polaribacter sp. TaxID=174711 RepID=UPI0026238214|nr:SusD/RagB family nutrient-binding outer membrane lipoprotein [uncultured Polaribacter sp.]
MKKIKKYGLMLMSVALLTQCDDNLTDLNVDPNSAVTVAPSTLLTTAQYYFYNTTQGVTVNADWGQLMVQQWSQTEYTEDSRYNQDINFFNGTWSRMYADVLKELDAAKTLVESQDLSADIINNQKNIIDVMSSQVFAFLTDGFEKVPYTEAIGENSLPKYDSQEVIYKGILETLENAANTFSASSQSFTSGDIIYNGDVTKWIKLTNSLMLRYAMRIADVDLATATRYINLASSNLISSNDENALFTFETSLVRSNPLYRNNTPLEGNRDDYAVSEYLVNTLTSLGDPRLAKFANNASSGSIVGMPYGLSDNDATVLKPDVSRPNDNVRSATTPHVIMSYAEVQLLLAEAYQRGILTGNAATAYANGVTASMNYWGITDAAAIATYVSNNAYDSANWKMSIGTQKWVALYMNGFQAWNEWRRLDYPQLSAPAAAVINSIPVRMPYPLSETTSNASQLDLVTTNPNDMQTKVWWDVN